MARSPRLEYFVIATLLPILLLPTICSGHTTHYIKPAHDALCPLNPCLTLSEYARQPHRYLTSNTTLLLLPGDHVLDVNFTVENVSNFELYAQPYSPTYGHSASKITCMGLVGFTFRNTSNVMVHGLTFNSCGKDAITYYSNREYTQFLTTYGMSIVLGKDMEIVNCTFQGSVGTALGVFHSSLNLKGSNSFISNCRGCSNRNHTCTCLGGGMFTNTSTLIIAGNTNFRDNTAGYGGGISVWNSILQYTGNSTFGDNRGVNGGGIYAQYSTLSFIGNHTLANNSAADGGGINAWYSTMDFTGNSTFRNNWAFNGGGINAQYSTINFTGNYTFTTNSAADGGGINSCYSTIIFTRNHTFRNNSAAKGGGIYAENSNLNFAGNNILRNNSGIDGGGIHVFNSDLNFKGNSVFKNNLAKGLGGGINAWYSTMSFIGNHTITNNSAKFGGGVYSGSSTLNIEGNCTFRNNSAAYGGGITILHSTLKFVGNLTSTNNSAEGSGGGINALSSTLNFNGSNAFRSNSATYGGGINARNTHLSCTGNNAFRNNTAKTFGGGINAWNITLNFTGNAFRDNAAAYGGGISALGSILNFTGNIFMDNSALIHGGAVYTGGSTLNFERFSIFSGNSVQHYGGGIYSDNSNMNFSGNTTFSSNSGRLKGGGIYGLGTFLLFNGNSSFIANTAAKGGGQYLTNSFNFLSKNTTFTMDSNNSTEYGGAVYVVDSDLTSYCFPAISKVDMCIFQIHELFEVQYNTRSNLIYTLLAYFNIHLHFYNNHAQMAGSAVYGGSFDRCNVRVDYKSTDISSFVQSKLYIPTIEPNSITSDPFQVCPCDDGIPYCNTSELLRQVHPGELLRIPVVATGQRDGIIPAVVRAFFRDTRGNTTLAQFQATQEVKKGCTELHYQFHSSITNNSDILVLYADGPCLSDGKLLSIFLQFLPCPHGFSLNSSDGTCGCEPRLQTYITRCNITERTVTREGDYWVGYNSHFQALILHPHCPFDYCKPGREWITFPLNNTDLQCENNRSGLLCGECKLGLSLTLGSTKCLKCSNLHILLLIPFALAGIALVLLLLIFKLTVAAGTINGLIFYANIVTVNRAIFFPPNQTNILTVFIAWLNLDFGIETCFFDGLDEYVKTWLQFVFPFYVWSLVGLIIIGSEYSSRIAKLFGSNPVAVLVTLFLLSYGKLLRTIITAIFFTFLDYPDEVQVAVWLYDGNIQYFHGKHIILFLVALVIFLFLFLPYTIVLTVGQWLQAKSNGKFFYWVNKPRIKPLLDAYQAPYRDKHRYWTGLLLCLRCVLFLVFAFNTRADPSLNLLAISSVAFGLTLVTRYTGAVYKRLHVDVLEASFILNLGIFAVATYYVKLAVVPVSQAAVAYTSVGIAFTTFIGVLLYHTYQQVWPKLQQRCVNKSESPTEYIGLEEITNVDHKVKHLAPTVTIIERPIPRPLNLIYDDSRSKVVQPLIAPSTKFFELREPLNLIDSDDR